MNQKLPTLDKLFRQTKADKGSKHHHYHLIYGKDFKNLRGQKISILEVGIWKGASHEAWLEYFPNAMVYGIDTFQRIDPNSVPILDHSRMNWMVADSMNAGLPQKIRKEWGQDIQFDIIIDDGKHTPAANTKTFRNLFQFLKPDGSYYVEDAWPLDIMGTDELSHPWIKKNPMDYNMLQMTKFIQEIEQHDVERFDLRDKSGLPDSYIFRIRRKDSHESSS